MRRVSYHREMSTRRTSRRRTSLARNARPIPPDRQMAGRLMGPITKTLRRLARLNWEQFGGNAGVKPGDVLLSIPFTLRDVAGRTKKLRLVMMAVERFFPSGGEVRRRENTHPRLLLGDEEAVVLVYAQFSTDDFGDASWRGIASDDRLRKIRATLGHELLHAADIIDRSNYAYAPRIPRPTPYDLAFRSADSWTHDALYYNRKHELRAFLPMILGEVRALVKRRMRRMGRSGGVGAGHVEIAVAWGLQESATWRSFEQYLTPKNRNLILKGLITALEDEGIIAVR
jgi:hypothetical protein